jgi:RND superfamily putative drug exporter
MTLLDEAREEAGTRSRRPRIVWVFSALAIVLFLIGAVGGSFQGKLADVQKNDNSAWLPGSADSTKVANEQEKFTSIQSIPGFLVFHRSPRLTADDIRWIDSTLARVKAVKGVSANEVHVQAVKADVEAISGPLIGKKNGTPAKGPDLVNAEKNVLKAARDGAPAGLQIHSAGVGGLLVAFIDAFSGLDSTLIFAALGVVIFVLLLVYRSPVLWIFPLLCSMLALGAASIVIYTLAKHGTITLNGQSQGILYVLVIGAGTDYALLLISRYREELHEHESRVDAMIAAWKGAAPPIVASALTVMLGLLCLTFAEMNSTRGLGPVCAIGVACTGIVMLTLLPVLLVISGRWIFWPRRPNPDHRSDILEVHGVWSRFSQALARHHRRGWAGAGILLIACVAGIFTLRTGGLSTAESFRNTPDALVGQRLYDASFPSQQGAGAPVVILTDTGAAPEVMAKVRKVPGVSQAGSAVCLAPDYGKVGQDPVPFVTALANNSCPPDRYAVTPQGGKTLVNAMLTSPYDSSAAYQTVKDIRHVVSGIAGADALVGGASAVNIDIQNASRHDEDLIIPIVLVVILVVLGIVLRALVAPVLLIATVVLSFAAALGVSALVFNHLFHFANADPGFPLFAFVFLVALGIDYNIFLMTRVREEALQHGTRQGVVRGLAVTGGVITSAGLVLTATFTVLSVLPLVAFAEIGFTVAFGVLLDTVIVRSILVPSLSHEFGKRIWWPSRLAAAGAPD